MGLELTLLVWSVVLLFGQITIQAVLRDLALGLRYNVSPRDEPVTLDGKAGRAERMLKNFLETYPAFIALTVAVSLLEASGSLTQWGAIIYFVARIAYVPLYLFGVAYVRSAVWFISSFGLFLMLLGLTI